jgi:outer membrane protein, multidrug efflux system
MKLWGIFTLGLVVLLAGCSINPEPYSDDEIRDIAIMDELLIYNSQEPLSGQMTLEEAMARALKYNLGNRVNLLEEVVANASFDLSKRDMLPSLTASINMLDRNNIDASTSVSVLTGQVSLEPSTSVEQNRQHRDLRFSWNILDFGVSYLQAKQDADRYLMANKLRRKVMVNLLNDVRSAYWKAATMDSMRQELENVTESVETMLVNLQQVRKEQLRTPIFILNDIRLLIETTQQLDQIREEVNLAEMQLASLINVPIGTKLDLYVPNELANLPKITTDIESLELYALTNSSDYTNEVYRVRIDQRESKKALLQILPGIEFSYGQNYNSNKYLYNDQWGEAGVYITGDLIRLVNYNRIKKYNEANEELSISRRLAVNMAVVAGVHLSWQEYQNARDRLEQASLLQQIDQEIAALSLDAEKQESGSGIETMQNEFTAFRSEMAQLLSYAESQQAFGSLLVSVGMNPVPEDYQAHSVEELSEVLRINFQKLLESESWNNGEGSTADYFPDSHAVRDPYGNKTVDKAPIPCSEADCVLSRTLNEKSMFEWL